MSKQIDERIVQMTFENRAFEQGIQNSIKSLKTLDSSLSQLDKSGKTKFNVSFESANLITALDNINHRLSATGVIGARVLENLTDKAVAFANKGILGVFNQIKEGGKARANNIENAKFQLMGLLKDSAKVQEIMNNASDSVQDTAYGMDQAAKAAAMFAASGIQGGQQMLSTLNAIAGVSAQANADYDSIAHIFTTVAGNGRVMAMQLNQLAIHGLNAAAVLSDYMDEVKDDSSIASEDVRQSVDAIIKKFGTGEAAIRDAVSKGMVSFNMFSEAMEYTFGEHAKDANKTFTGSMANMKAALSRIGQKFYQPLIQSGIEGMQQQSSIITLFNTLKKKINQVNAELDPFANMITGRILDAAQKLSDWADSIYIAPIMDDFNRLVDVIKTLGEVGVNIFNDIRSVLDPVGLAFKEVWLSTGIDVIEVLQKGANKLRDFTAGFRLLYSGQVKVNSFLENVLYGVEQTRHNMVFLGKTFINIIKQTKLFSAIGGGLKKVFGWLFGLTEKLFILLQKIDLEKLANKLDLSVDKIKGAMLAGASVIIQFINELLNLFNVKGDTLIEKFNSIAESFNNSFGKIANSGLLDSIKSKFKKNVDDSVVVAETFEAEMPKLYGAMNRVEVKTLEMGKTMEETTGKQVNNLSYLKDKLVESVTKAVPGLQSAMDKVSVILTGKAGDGVNIFSGVIDSIKETYVESGVFGVLKMIGGKLIEAVKTIVHTLYEYTQTPEFKVFKEIFLSFNFVKIMRDISKWGGLLGNKPLFFMQNGIFGSGNNNSIKNTQAFSKSLLEFAGSVLILVGALKLLSTIPAEKTVEPLIALGSLMAGLTTMTGILGSLGKNFENSKRSALLLIALSAALLMASAGLAKLASVENDQNQIMRAMEAMTLTIVAIGGVMFKLKELTGSMDVKDGETLRTLGSILLIGIAVSSIGKALAKLASNDPAAIITAGATLGLIVAAFVKISAMWAGIKITPVEILTLAFMMQVLTSSFLILSASLVAVSLIPIDKMSTGLRVMAGLLLSVAGVAVIVGLLGEGMAKGAAAFAAFAIGVALLAVVIKKMSELENPAKATTVMLGIGALLLAFGFTISILDNVDTRNIQAKVILGLVGGLTLIMIGISVLTKTIEKHGFLNMLGAIASIALVLAAFVGLLYVLDKIKLKNGAAWNKFQKLAVAIKSLAIAILAMAAACAIFAKVPWQGIAKAGVVLAGLLVAFGALVGMAALFGNSFVIAVRATTALGKSFLLMGAGIALAAAALIAFSLALMFAAATAIPTLYLGLQNLKIFIEGLCDIIIELGPKLRSALAELIVIMFGAIIDAWPRLKEMTLQAILQFGELLDEYTPQIVDVFANFLIHAFDRLAERVPEILQAVYRFLDALAGGMRNPGGGFVTKILLEISGIALIITALGAIPGSALMALAGLAVMTEIMIGLVAIMSMAGMISVMPGVKWLMNKGADLFELIGHGIGKFVGGLVAGIGEGMSHSFVDISENLSEGMDKLKPFLEAAKEIDQDVVDGVSSLAKALIAITASTFLNGIERILHLGNGYFFQDFGTQLAEFGGSFHEFYDSIKDITDTEAVKNICDSILLLAEAAKEIPNSGGVLGFFMGDNDINQFGYDLEHFGHAFRRFYDSLMEDDFLVNLKPELIEPMKQIISIMCMAAKEIPNSGGILGEWMGENDIDKFAEMLAAAGPNIVDFCKSVEGITASQVEGAKRAVDAISGITKIAGDIKGDVVAACWGPTGLFGAMLSQESGANVLVEALPTIGQAIAEFCKEVDGLNTSNAVSAATACKILGETLVALTGAGITGRINLTSPIAAAVTLFQGRQNGLSAMAQQLPKLGKAIAEFAKSVEGVRAEEVKDIAEIVRTLADIMVTLQSVDQGRKFWRNDTNLSDFGKQIKSLGESFKDFYNKLKKVDVDKLQIYMNAINALAELMDDSSRLVDKSGYFQFLAADFIAFAEILSRGLANACSVSTEEIDTVMQSLTDLLNSMRATIESGIGDLATYIENTLSNDLQPNTYRDVAFNRIIIPLVNGMTDARAKTRLINASKTVSVAANNGLKQKANPNLWKQIALNLVQGFINGLTGGNIGFRVANAAANIGVYATNAVKKKLGINSPSKVFEQLGVYTVEGFIGGVKSMEDSLGGSMDSISNSAIEAMRDNLYGISDAISRNADLQPKITPVLDLDSLRNDAGAIDGVFSNTTFKMATETSALERQIADAKAVQKSMSIDDRKLVGAITELRHDVNAMGAQMSSLQVVMDSGALVGQISTPMDRALGSMITRRSREA